MSSGAPAGGGPYDLAIVGGGIVGAGVARDAALRGLTVALFERGDVGGATSSHTSKLVHGGIRYLEQLQLALVREALEERARLLQLAPHLVWPLPFLVPFYRGHGRPRWWVETGLFLYEGLAGGHKLGRFRHLSASEARGLEPELEPDDLEGAALFLDAQMDDARLCLENALDAADAGAEIFTHHEVASLAREGGVWRLTVRERLRTGDTFECRAAAVVNAGGPWSDALRALAGHARREVVRPSRGAHLMVPALVRRNALLLTARRDRRIFFVLPQAHGSLVGTTEAEHEGDRETPRPTAEDVRYLVEEVRARWPEKLARVEDVHRAFAGLRPLARQGGPVGRASREDRILSEDGLHTVVGGKYTTYRAVAERAVDRVVEERGRGEAPSRTAETPLRGGRAGTREQAAAAAEEALRDRPAFTVEDARRVGARYGGRLASFLEVARDDGERLDLGERTILQAEVVHAVRNELAQRLEDVLLRRLGLWQDRAACRRAAPVVARWMARELGWSQERTEQEFHDVTDELGAEEQVIREALAG